MTQHAGYLGRMRGLPAALSQVPSSGGYGDPQNDPSPPLPLSVTRTFSNSAQRHISSELCATVSGGAHQRDALSPNLSPLQSIYTALPMSPMSPMSPISLMSLMPPMPTGPLVRQIACDISSRSSSVDS